MPCPGCGAATEAGQKFCVHCGTRLAVTCQGCGAPLPEEARFCGECGRPVAGAEPRLAEARAGSERRLVTVVFADLVGFTSLAEERDPEEVRGFLSEYFEAARDVVTRYGGTVEKFIGDAVMGLWGSPVTHEDDAERAVRAALDLVTEISALGDRSGIPHLQVRAGVATGEAAVLLEAEGQGMVAGDLVNTASRLQDSAPPGTVLVDEPTLRTTQEAISYTPVGEVELKGKAAPVPVWRPGQVVAKRGGAGRSRGLEPPFVGRTVELQLLKDLFRATLREGRAHLVSVTGIAGIGKTRLAWEFEKYLDGLTDLVYWHQGRSPSYGDGITFWALGEMVRRRARIAETDDRETAAAKLTAVVEEFVPEEDRSWIEPRLAVLLGLAEAPEGDREELFAAWRSFFERIADRGPVVMVFEDLQWADQGLLDFIESLLEWSRSHPIFLLTLARPELTDRRPTWGVGQRRFASLHLEPLTDREMGELLEGLVPGLPEDLAARIRERAAGIPLYAVETVRMLIDRGNLARSDGAYELVSEVEELAVPESLHALLAARLDALEGEDRRMLQRATVLGQVFTLRGLSALEDQEPDKLERRLEELVRREILTLDADPRSPERGQYGFVQGVLREVAYGTLSRAERRDLHLRVADYLEGLEDDELAGAVAHHYLGARQADPEDPDLVARAKTALLTAAERASALGSHDQELAYLEQVIEIVDDPDELAGLWEAAARACEHGGAYERAEPYLRRAIDQYAPRDPAAFARATALLGGVLLLSSRVEEAIETIEAALAEQPEGSGPQWVTLRGQLARAFAFHEQGAEALRHVEETLEEAAVLDLVPVIADALVTKGWALSLLGRDREALAITEGALHLAIREGLAGVEFRARNNLAAFGAWEDPHWALEVVQPGMELARRLGHADHLAALGHKAVRAAIDIGDWDLATAIAEDVRRPGISFFSGFSLDVLITELIAYQGDLDAARRAVEELRPAAEASTSPQDRLGFHRTCSWVAFATQDFQSALESAREAWSVFQESMPDSWVTAAFANEGHAALALRDPEALEAAFARLGARQKIYPRRDAHMAALRGGLALLTGDREAALPLLQDGVARLDDLGLPPARALLQTEMALLLGRDDPIGESSYQQARETWEHLGARPFLERLEAG